MISESHQFPAELGQLSCIADVVKAAVQHVDAAEPEMFAYAVELSVHEACVNCIEHAYAGRDGVIQLDLAVTAEQFRVTITNWGEPFDPTDVSAPDLAVPQVGGYGLFLMRELMDDWAYRTQGGCNQLIMTKGL